MDRITAAGLALDAQLQPGRRIAVVAPRQTEARDAMQAVAGLGYLLEGAKIRWANGNEEIKFPNGSRIIFRSGRQSLRGWSLDLVYVHPDVPRHILSEDSWKDWLAVTNPSLILRQGELILGW